MHTLETDMQITNGVGEIVTQDTELLRSERGVLESQLFHLSLRQGGEILL